MFFFDQEGNERTIADIVPCQQHLHLWTGKVKSGFTVLGEEVQVETVCSPATDAIAVTVSSPLLVKAQIGVQMRFPNPNMRDREWEKTTDMSWDVNGHLTTLRLKDNQAMIERTLDDTTYYVQWDWNAGTLEECKPHLFRLHPSTSTLTFTMHFYKEKKSIQTVEDIIETSRKHWKAFWELGAFISFEGSSDKRAEELERRVVLSQYLLAVHSGGSVPPQETGFMYNSWFGKFHLEMHWWHASHFPMWGRNEILKKSLYWYIKILPKAYQLADYQGFEGARWPKMIGIEGNQTPSPIAPGLIWQQPHPIALAELCYQCEKDQKFLEEFEEIVFATAEFMVSFPNYDKQTETYQLGPGLIPAQENHLMEDTVNPTYELEYWHYGLGIAIEWMNRLGRTIPEKWLEVRSKMALPSVENDVYLAHRDCKHTFTEKNHDHPSMVAAYGILPGALIDWTVMNNTLQKVQNEWQWDTAWGWDFPMCAMTAARMGNSALAIDFLLMNQVKNTYLINGHNYQHDKLTAYLPGNGGLLTAVAMMATKWGFPNGWKVEYENLKGLLS
ncbi:glycoside hydrolase family 65 [Gracilibacillus caseinilyticus]|uniref:Glycoside hydrolase family 65 n=1 Tax=Gracilibacillus caseinilyticus TaxID=2932256 RepID=A0ABY4EQD6_9BACI|nr:glycoside hydrolase family 65 [Gracilibacillus caseinilyticus]UOQ46660.1 glycoside hydrolase family 65 [Gracilibacillus caseinilyticus]